MENLVKLNENELLNINGGAWYDPIVEIWDDLMDGFQDGHGDC